jgi:nucleoside-diphosphate-sugar epimerase
MSSSAIFGSVKRRDNPIPPDPPLKPIEVYGRSKYAGEQIVRREMEDPNGMSCSVIRPRTTIGTERLGIFQILYEWISEGRNIYIIGSGSNVFQFVHVQDLVNLSIESALQRKQGLYNAGTDRYGTLREALENLCAFGGKGSDVRGIPYWLSVSSLRLLDRFKLSPLGPWHYLTYHKEFYFDISFPIEELGWKPRYSNDEMLKESYLWYLENKDRLDKERSESSAHRGTLNQGILGVLKKLS